MYLTQTFADDARIFHLPSGHKISPKEHSNLEPKKTKKDGSRKKEGLKRKKEHDSRDSLNQSFQFKSYRPGSDMRKSNERSAEDFIS